MEIASTPHTIRDYSTLIESTVDFISSLVFLENILSQAPSIERHSKQWTTRVTAVIPRRCLLLFLVSQTMPVPCKANCGKNAILKVNSDASKRKTMELIFSYRIPATENGRCSVQRMFPRRIRKRNSQHNYNMQFIRTGHLCGNCGQWRQGFDRVGLCDEIVESTTQLWTQLGVAVDR